MRLSGLTIWGAQSFGDPPLDIAGSVSDVLTDSEPGRARTFVTPGVQRGDGHCQVLGQFPGREKTIEGIHDRIVKDHPVNGVFSECRTPAHEGCWDAGENMQRLAPGETSSWRVLDRAVAGLMTGVAARPSARRSRLSCSRDDAECYLRFARFGSWSGGG